MTSPLACFPLFTFFLSLAIMAVAAVTFGAKKANTQTPLANAPREELPAWWIILLIPTIIAALLGWLTWYTSDY